MEDLGTERILVTGAAGWLGRNLLHALMVGLPDCGFLPARLKEIRCLLIPGESEPDLPESSIPVKWVQGDLRSEDDCREFCGGSAGAVLIHTAGVIHPRKRVSEFYDVNLEGTKKLMTAAAAAGVKRAVVVSSNSPTGCNPQSDHLFDEASPYRPYMNYGRSKMLMEMAVRAMHEEGKLEAVVIRAPWFYGPFQPPRQTLFFKMIEEGRCPIVGDGNNLRSMAYMENLAQGLLLAAAVPEAGGNTYWIADERPYSMNEIVDTIEQLLESEFGRECAHKRMRLPSIASEAAWLVDKSLQAIGFYHQKIHVLSEMNKTIACSVDRAKQELGYRPTVGLEEGMRRSIRSLPDYHDSNN